MATIPVCKQKTLINLSNIKYEVPTPNGPLNIPARTPQFGSAPAQHKQELKDFYAVENIIHKDPGF